MFFLFKLILNFAKSYTKSALMKAKFIILAFATALLAATTSCGHRTSFFCDKGENDAEKQENVVDIDTSNIIYNKFYVEEYEDGIKIVDKTGNIIVVLDGNGDIIYQEENCCESGDTVVLPMVPNNQGQKNYETQLDN